MSLGYKITFRKSAALKSKVLIIIKFHMPIHVIPINFPPIRRKKKDDMVIYNIYTP